ncbi:MAG: hypothetical protein GIW97_02850 [Candidatus Eremiobacteraeota bacterium]|nr:hypothetical protein [Candidatus Eremiobacteraeota bacterium]
MHEPPPTLCGSIHLCFPNESTKQTALEACGEHAWKLKDDDRPLCATSTMISVGEFCKFAATVPEDQRKQTKVTFIPATKEIAAFLEYFNVNNLQLLHARCEQMLVSSSASANGARASC